MAGMPIWYELLTTDVAGAKRFYGDVVGWKADDMPVPKGGDGSAYTIFGANDGQGVAGLMQQPDGAPTGPTWLAYFHVEDVDAKVAANEGAGGVTHMPATDMPGVGRMAMVADPQGILHYLMDPTPPEGEGESTSFSETLPQRCSWNELVTSDHKAALEYYGAQLGWRSTEAMPMGPMGDYSFVDVSASGGDVRIGAMMDAQPEMPKAWTFYFKIPDVDAAVATVEAGGGKVVQGPMEVPGGQRIIVVTDPQGAHVGFVSGEEA